MSNMEAEYQEMMALLHEAASYAPPSEWLDRVTAFLNKTPWFPNPNAQVGGWDKNTFSHIISGHDNEVFGHPETADREVEG